MAAATDLTLLIAREKGEYRRVALILNEILEKEREGNCGGGIGIDLEFFS